MSAAQVMRVAQGLYERGYITYMRTDSTTLSDTAVAAARQVIERQFGREYLTDAPRTYAKKAKNAQEAHEAIRPAGDTLPHPRPAARRAARRRPPPLRADLAAHAGLPDARRPRPHGHRCGIAATTADDVATEWTASGRTITFPGWLAVYGYSGDDDAEDDGRRQPPSCPTLDRGPGAARPGHRRRRPHAPSRPPATPRRRS